MSKVNLQIEDKVYRIDEPVFEEIKKAFKEIERLNNIIKEVREYIEAEKVIKEGNTLEQITKYERNILEILDKGE